MPLNLPTDMLRSFVAIVEAGSMLRAADRVCISQSALSLQMKRLEDMLQVALFRREGRRLVLSAAGTRFLADAREMLVLNDRAVAALSGGSLIGPARIGFVQDFAETLLSGVLSHFCGSNPETQLEVRVAGSAELLELLGSGRLDLVLCMGDADDPRAIGTAQMLWLGEPALAEAEVLPLAVLERPCRFRDAAIAALEAAGRRYRIMLETPSLSALRAAIQGGIGLTCRTDILTGRGPAIAMGVLPPLPRISYVLHQATDSHAVIGHLHDLISHATLVPTANAARPAQLVAA